MNELIKLFAEYEVGTILIIFILFCLAIKGIVEFIEWLKRKLEDWRKNKNEPEEKEENMISRISSLEARVAILETHDKKQYEKLGDIETKLEDIAEANKKQTVASFRSSLSRMYSDIMTRQPPYITVTEYETFQDLSEIYQSYGGNHSVKDKIIPEIEALYRKQNIS